MEACVFLLRREISAWLNKGRRAPVEKALRGLLRYNWKRPQCPVK